MNIGENIKKIRQERNITQAQLADLINTSRVALGNYERGDRVPTADVIIKIANVLDVTPNDLFGISIDFEQAKKLALYAGFYVEKAPKGIALREEDKKVERVVLSLKPIHVNQSELDTPFALMSGIYGIINQKYFIELIKKICETAEKYKVDITNQLIHSSLESFIAKSVSNKK